MTTILVQPGPFSIETAAKLGSLFSLVLVTACSNAESAGSRAPSAAPIPASMSAVQPARSTHREIKLLADDSLAGWKISNFGGEGECSVKNGQLVIEMGYPLSGVTSTRKDLPTRDYEMSLEAKRTQGNDFFCGLTFPVNDSHCTLIVGGWAGAVVGLSCVDEQDAARNATKKIMKFDDDRWYRIRVKVGDAIEAWVDDQQVVNLATAGHKFSLRAETLVSRPLGICTFETSAAYRNVVIRDYSAEMETAITTGH
jgi:hypothetical protein